MVRKVMNRKSLLIGLYEMTSVDPEVYLCVVVGVRVRKTSQMTQH